MECFVFLVYCSVTVNMPRGSFTAEFKRLNVATESIQLILLSIFLLHHFGQALHSFAATTTFFSLQNLHYEHEQISGDKETW